MGTITSKDTRRISFDNKFALNSAFNISKPLNEIIDFENIAADTTSDLIFPDSKCIETPEESEIDYWSHRIENLKKEHQIINKIVEIEYDKQIQATNEVFEPPKITHERIQKIKPCFDWRAKIMQCYADNPHQPLACSTAVSAFSKCIASCRAADE